MPPALTSPIVFFTGAGISVGAGLPTYRGAGGLYESGNLAPPNAGDITEERLPGLWERFRPRVSAFNELQPSRAHAAIATLESRSPADSITVVTQNVDGLHSQAGSQRVIELHGSLRMVRCLADGSTHAISAAPWSEGDVPRCPACGAMTRPDVVLFGESLPQQSFASAEAALGQARTIVAVGTSAQVYPAASLITPAYTVGANLYWVNPQTGPPGPGWTWLQGAADDELVDLLATV